MVRQASEVDSSGIENESMSDYKVLSPESRKVMSWWGGKKKKSSQANNFSRAANASRREGKRGTKGNS